MKKPIILTGVAVAVVGIAVGSIFAVNSGNSPKKSATVIPITIKKASDIMPDSTPQQPVASDTPTAPVTSPDSQPTPTTNSAATTSQTAPEEATTPPAVDPQPVIITHEGNMTYGSLPPGTSVMYLDTSGNAYAK